MTTKDTTHDTKDTKAHTHTDPVHDPAATSKVQPAGAAHPATDHPAARDAAPPTTAPPAKVVRTFKPFAKEASITLNASKTAGGDVGFAVVEVTGALDPLPGEHLTMDEATTLAKDAAWTVTVKRLGA